MTRTPQWALERIGEVKENQLEELDLDGSLQEELLFEIPIEVSHLYWLRSLNLSNNQLTSISTEIFDVESLVNINLTNNPIEIPPEIINKGIESIKEYLKQMEESKTDYLYEAKLLLVGEGGSGKTSLATKILNFENELKPDEYSTSGIRISSWYFPLENGKKFRVNIWDFGGQEIYHATHQLFLTKRSLYLLVVDTRREHSDFYYWLNVIELYGDDSPVLIIKNEMQDRSTEINERELRGQFSNLKATLATNLATNRGFTEILEEIKYCIKALPHIGDPLPKIWVRIREALEFEPRSYITLDDYISICCEHGLTRQEEQILLSSYLHDLGIVLHFQDDPILKRFLILEPTWATGAIYQVVDSYTVLMNSGIFNRSNLTSIWSNQEYSVMQDELLQLMLKFSLCYQIPGELETYIIPQHLTTEQPDYDWDEANNLILRYQYEFMPKGIITRLIIALHELILGQKYVWRSGVILSVGQTKAEVIEYHHRHEIVIRVLGESKRDLLSTITFELDKVNSSYARLKYKKLIPCNCNVCRDTESPQFYSFESLINRVKAKKNLIECPVSYQDVSITGILYGILEEGEISLLESNRLPISIFNQNTVEVQNYVEQMNAQGAAFLYEAKILLVGEPAAGKTTLMKKLTDPQYKVPVEESSTLGITVCRWKFPFAKDSDVSFNANIWDFGGQEIQYSLHHFFLTSQSLYILVVDDRRQHTEFDYWFNIIRILGGNSSILVVLNEKNYKSITNFDLKTYSERYPELKIERRDVDFSLEDGRFDGLVRKIQEMLSNLEHIGDELPAKWIFIRAELEELKSKNFISIEEYFDICDRHEVKEEADKLLLSKYLHNLGVILHFQDDISLSNTIFLNPQWVVHGIYTILSNKRLEEDGGRFSKNWLFQLWTDKNYSFQERNLLLNLMRKDNLDLCYQMNFSHGNEYIFPQLLPSERPTYEWNDQNNLKFRFQYPFMPKGIISHLIVRLSSFIAKDSLDRDLVWQRGVVFIKNDDVRNDNRKLLERELTKAEIAEGIDKDGLRVINIKVSGLEQEKKDLLAIVRKEILDIHKRFGSIIFNQKIPCNCEFCDSSVEPYFFDYDYDILRRIRVKIYIIECGESFQKIEILNLIDNVIDRSQKGLLPEDDRMMSKGYFAPTIYVTQSQDKSQSVQEGNHSMSTVNQYGFGNNIAGDQVMGDKIDTQINNSQNLTQAAQDIKELLNQLSKEYPNNSVIVGAKALEAIDSTPTLKRRVVKALKEAGATALEKLVDHPAVSIVVAGAKGFMDD